MILAIITFIKLKPSLISRENSSSQNWEHLTDHIVPSWCRWQGLGQRSAASQQPSEAGVQGLWLYLRDLSPHSMLPLEGGVGSDGVPWPRLHASTGQSAPNRLCQCLQSKSISVGLGCILVCLTVSLVQGRLTPMI